MHQCNFGGSPASQPGFSIPPRHFLLWVVRKAVALRCLRLLGSFAAVAAQPRRPMETTVKVVPTLPRLPPPLTWRPLQVLPKRWCRNGLRRQRLRPSMGDTKRTPVIKLSKNCLARARARSGEPTTVPTSMKPTRATASLLDAIYIGWVSRARKLTKSLRANPYHLGSRETCSCWTMSSGSN